MKMLKRKILRIFFGAEIFVFFLAYFFGSQGFYNLQKLKHENAVLEKDIFASEQELSDLAAEVVAWQTEPFYKEKLAREHLHMARTDEEIYYLND